VIEGTAGADYFEGGKGADTLIGAGGPDTFKGGKGNDTIRGGENGLDEWGNAGQDVAMYSGDESDYEYLFYTAEGKSSTSFEFDGYITVQDLRSDEDVVEGTDTLYGIEALQFADNFVTFLVNNSFVDLDGDGIADVGDQKGTSSDDWLTGGDIDDNIHGKAGDDTIIGALGDDFLKGGSGADFILGGSGEDVASFAGSIGNYEITVNSGKYVGYDAATDAYELDASGAIAQFAASDLTDGNTTAGNLGVELMSVVREISTGVTETDYIAHVEYLEFSDAFGGYEIEVFKDDYDYDGAADFVFIGGSFVDDALTSAHDGISAEDLSVDNFIDGGRGADTIEAGAGNDTIDPGRDEEINKIDGGTGNDVVILSGDAADWTADHDNALTGYTHYFYTVNASDEKLQEILLKNVEGIEFDDQFLNLVDEAVKVEIDNDGDGTADEFKHRGRDIEDAVVADVGDKVDVIDAGGGDDVITAGDGADVLIGGTGDDFIFGGANTGVNQKGKQDKDKAVFDGNYLASTDENGEAVAADISVNQAGFVAQLSCDPQTGELCLLTWDGTTFDKILDSAIASNAKPTVFADIRDVYVATLKDGAPEYDEESNPDASYVTSVTVAEGEQTEATLKLIADESSVVVQFDEGTNSETFDEDTMELRKAYEMVFEVDEADADAWLIKDAAGAFVMNAGATMEFATSDAAEAYGTENSLEVTAVSVGKKVTFESIGEKLDVYEVKKGDEIDTVVGVEQLEFSDTVIDLKAESQQSISFDINTGITEVTQTYGSDFADHILGSEFDEFFEGGDGGDIFEFNHASGSDRIEDFSVGEDKIEVLSGINGQNINSVSDILGRLDETSEGVVIDFGNVDAEQQSVLLVGISKDDLSADDFLLTYL